MVFAFAGKKRNVFGCVCVWGGEYNISSDNRKDNGGERTGTPTAIFYDWKGGIERERVGGADRRRRLTRGHAGQRRWSEGSLQ